MARTWTCRPRDHHSKEPNNTNVRGSSLKFRQGSLERSRLLEQVLEWEHKGLVSEPLKALIEYGASFQGVIVEKDWNRKHLTGDLSGLDLRDANLIHADFRDADLTGADLSGSRLPQSEAFTGATMTSVNLENCQLINGSEWLESMARLQPSVGLDMSRWTVEPEDNISIFREEDGVIVDSFSVDRIRKR